MQERPDGTLRALCDCGPVDAQTDRVSIKEPSVMSSSDGGLTWTSLGQAQGLATGTEASPSFAWVTPLSDDHWVGLIEPYQTLVETDDGGFTWRTVSPSGLAAGLLPRDLSAPVAGWAIATTNVCATSPDGDLGCWAQSSSLYATSDGTNWTEILTPS
jgi:photosystem II stability/assembly factor-like uncharacterized protein